MSAIRWWRHRWRRRGDSGYWDCADCGEFMFDLKRRKRVSYDVEKVFGPCSRVLMKIARLNVMHGSGCPWCEGWHSGRGHSVFCAAYDAREALGLKGGGNDVVLPGARRSVRGEPTPGPEGTGERP